MEDITNLIQTSTSLTTTAVNMIEGVQGRVDSGLHVSITTQQKFQQILKAIGQNEQQIKEVATDITNLSMVIGTIGHETREVATTADDLYQMTTHL